MIATLNGFTCFFSLIVLVFYSIGTLGYSDGNDVLEKLYWFLVDTEDLIMYAGLQKMVFKKSGEYGAIYYGDTTACTEKFCDLCYFYGNLVFPLLVVSAIATFIVLIMSFIGTHYPSIYLNSRSIVLSIIATLSALVGWGSFMNNCYLSFTKSYTTGVGYGPGSSLPLIGFLLMFFASILQIIATVLGILAERVRVSKIVVYDENEHIGY